MSAAVAKNEIARFLASKGPEVLCITGDWGVGKTFSWNEYLKEALEKDQVPEERYAYVSLFGLTSLADLKSTIVENTVPTDLVAAGPSANSFSKILHGAEKLVRSHSYLAQAIPKAKDAMGSLGRAVFLLVRDQIICFDDLERAGKGLEPREVLGLASLLKEQRRCKVVLLLNDGAFPPEQEEDFRAQLEKVVDTRIRFDPTPAEAAEIGLSASIPNRAQLIANCVTLAIKNIRVIKNIERTTERLREILVEEEPDVIAQAIQTVTLFTWIHQQPIHAPPLAFARKFNSYAGLLDKKKDVSDEEKSWRSLLTAYGYSMTDEFDEILIDSLDAGFFDAARLKAAAAKQGETVRSNRADNSFQAAWDAYHQSFDNDQEEVLDRIVAALRSSVRTVSPLNLNGTIRTLKDLGREAQAKEIVEFYVDARKDQGLELFDLKRYPFASDITDPDVRAAFDKALIELRPPTNPSTTLHRIAGKDGWNTVDIESLSTATPEQFKMIFKAAKGKELTTLVHAALQFGRIGNATPEMKAITTAATEALRSIGTENAINARRMALYGISIDDQPGAGDGT